MALKSDASDTRTGSDQPAGVDVSHWQGDMNWAKCAAAGIKFAFIRSTIGASGLDNRFAENWSGAEAAGLLRGAYHLFRPDRDAIAQAEHFVATAAKLGELPPAVDLEHVPGAAIQPSYPEEVRLFLELLLAGTGRKPIIYTSPSFWQNPLGAPAWGSEYDLWQAQWTSAETPDEMAP
jgi:lysozyme